MRLSLCGWESADDRREFVACGDEVFAGGACSDACDPCGCEDSEDPSGRAIAGLLRGE